MRSSITPALLTVLCRYVTLVRRGISSGRRTRTLTFALIILSGHSLAAHAAPILYTISGHIRYNGGAYEEYHGAFTLSDPTTEFFALSDSRGDQADLYTVSAFTLSSDSYSLTGYGNLLAWWALYRGEYRGEPIWFNTQDSHLLLTTSAGYIESGVGWDVEWYGDPGMQPRGFYSFGNMPFGVSGDYYVIQDMTAVQAGSVAVPEPASLLLLGTGVVSAALMRRRNERSI